jgi:hypothetical protein
MYKLGKYGQRKLIIGLVSLLSVSFLASAPFESNPQGCGMVSVIKRKNKDGDPAADDEAHMPV